MASIKLRFPDSEEPLRLPLLAEVPLLVGRAPSLKGLHSGLRKEVSGLPIQLVKVPLSGVSANHLLVRYNGATAVVWDMHGRAGGWLELTPFHVVRLPGEAVLVFDGPEPSHGAQPPITEQEPDRSKRPEYSAELAGALRDWLQRSGRPERLDSAPEEQAEDQARGSGEVARSVSSQPVSRYEQQQGHDTDFIMQSPLLCVAHRHVVDAAAYGMRLMILGPTGVGKERLARCFQVHSKRHRGPYATVNCALLKDNHLYAQLFGAKKGSYSGASQDMVGVVEAANEGTLFLDEVGELDLEVQKSLLRFLDSHGEYQRLGDSHTRRTNVQIVCATNLPLDRPEERRGRFRDDLWYRLAVKVVHVPPLRQRPEDILAFLQSRCIRGGQLRAIDAFTAAALEMVLADPWPGNFRDLENFLERLPATEQPGAIDEAICGAALHEGHGPTPSAPALAPAALPRPLLQAAPGDHWKDIAGVAAVAFEEDHGGGPQNWGQLQVYMEKYLKPIFIASSCGLQAINEVSKNINYSELARRLNIGDGTTVKMHLQRYVERFRKNAAPEAS